MTWLSWRSRGTICSKYSNMPPRPVSGDVDSVLSQEANFGILSFQPSGQRDANASHLVMEMLEQKRHRHCEYLKMLGGWRVAVCESTYMWWGVQGNCITDIVTYWMKWRPQRQLGSWRHLELTFFSITV